MDGLLFQSNLSPQQKKIVELYLNDKKQFEDIQRTVRKLRETVDNEHKLYVIGVLLAKPTKTTTMVKYKCDEHVTLLRILEQDVNLCINVSNNKVFKAFLLNHGIEQIKGHLRQIYSEINVLSEYMSSIGAYSFEKWIEMNFRKKPPKITFLSDDQYDFTEYSKYYDEILYRILLETKLKISPSSTTDDFVEFFNEKEFQCRNNTLFMEDFNIERAEKKMHRNQFQNFKFYQYLGLLEFEYNEPVPIVPQEPVFSTTGTKIDDFVSSLEKCFSNIVSYQNNMYYRDPAQLKQILSSNLSNAEKEEAILTYKKQNL
jgi:hypothetical protein